MNAIRGVLACAALLALPVHAQECAKADAAKAEKAIDLVVNYQQLRKAFQDYGHCDAGPVDELFTDAILRLMVEWKNVEVLAWDVQQDAKYKAFLHRHLMSPAAKADRELVYSRAKMSCPLAQDAFCNELVELIKPAK